jgi:hemoglobin/transferrin/lactoferrin receptor protein
MTFGRVALAQILTLSIAQTALAFEGRVVEQRTGAPIAGAQITIVGLQGSVQADTDGRFTWKPDPKPPFVVLVVLPGGQVAKPVVVEKLDEVGVIDVHVEAAVSEEVTVAAGVAPSIEAAPGAGMTMLSPRDFTLRAPANLMQTIENVPGVSQVSEGQAAVPAVRGLARGRTLILIDGSRVTSERRVGPSATFLDPSMLDGVDIARGPASVAYGSDALGGVISVRTRRPRYSGTFVDGSATVGVGIPERRVDGTLSRGFGKGGVLISAHARAADDYRGPGADVLNSGWSDRGLLVRAEHALGGGLLSGSWQSDFGRDIDRPRSNSNLVRFYYPFEDSHRFNASYERSELGPFDLVKLSGFLGSMKQRTDQDRIPTPGRPRDITRADVAARDFQLRVSADKTVGRTRLDVGADVNGRFGLEAHDILIQYDLAGGVTSHTDNLSTASAHRTDTGLFVQAQTALGSWATAAGGLRADYVRNVNEGGYFGDLVVSHGAAAGLASITAKPFSHVTLTAQIARGFRDPTLSDRFYRGPTGRGFITGNPDLRPETSLQVDLAARYASGRMRLAGYFYHYRIRNLVERYLTATDFSFFRNRGRAQLRGVEFEAQVDAGAGFALEGAAQVGRGRALDDNAALDDITPDTLSITLRKAFGEKVTSFVRLAGYAMDDRPGPSEVEQPGHTNLDAGVGYAITRQVEVRAAARNLLNARYYASPDPRWVWAPGRSAFATLKVGL